MKRVLSLIAVVALVALAVGCSLGGAAKDTGAVTIRFDNLYAKAAFTPPISMICAEYVVSATGPGGRTIPNTLVTGTTTFTDIVPGSWTFHAVGRNDAHIAIGEGSGTVLVVIGQTAPLNIIVQEYTSPNGSFLLDYSWEPNIVLNPLWKGTLTGYLGTPLAMSFTSDFVTCTGQSLTSDLSPGWRTMIVELWDAPNGDDETKVLSTGAACAVRVAAGRQTHGTLDLHAVQGFGTIDLSFTPDFYDELVLTPSSPFTPGPGTADSDYTIVANTPITLSVTSTETVTSYYYLRGQYQGSGNMTLDPAGLIFGESYRVDVVSFSIDGKKAGSGTWRVKRVAIDPETMKIAGEVQSYSVPGPRHFAVEVLKSPGGERQAIFTYLTSSGHYDFTYLFEAIPTGSYTLHGWIDLDNDQVMDGGEWEATAQKWTDLDSDGIKDYGPEFSAAGVISIPHPSTSWYLLDFGSH